MPSLSPRWPAPLAIALLLHGLFLWGVSSWQATSSQPREIVPIALQFGAAPGDGGAGEGASSGEPEAEPAPPAPVVAPPPPARVAPPPRPVVPAAKRPAAARPVIERPRSTKPEVEAAPAVVVDSASGGAAVAGATGGGSGTSAGDGGGGGPGGGEGRGGGGSGGPVDSRGFCVDCPKPDYPLIARHRGWSGRVLVGLRLLADGRADRVEVKESSGHAVLDQEALRVARASRFRLPDPGQAPLPGRIEYRFELDP